MRILVLTILLVGGLFSMKTFKPMRLPREDTDSASTLTYIDQSGKLYWNQGLNVVQTGVTIPGSICGLALDAPDGRDVLLAGRSQNGGILEHWELNTSSGLYTKKSSYQSSPSDFTGVTYDNINQRIFLLDANLKIIWVHSWDGQAALPSNNWQVWVSSTQIPQLSDADEQYLSIYQGNPQAQPQVLLGYEFGKDNTGGVDSYLLSENSNGVVAHLWVNGSWGASPFSKGGSASEGSNSTEVEGKEGANVELFDIANQVVIGSGTIPAGSTKVTVVSTIPLRIGDHYVARKAGTAVPEEWNFQCIRRYGAPETYSDGTLLGRIPAPLGNEIRNPKFMLVLPLTKDPAPDQPMDLVGNIAFAMRDPITGLDPIITIGQQTVLNTTIFFPIEGKIQRNGQGRAHLVLDIPNDPNLVGQVMLFQFWMADGVEVRLSEIVGVVINGPSPLAKSSTKPGKNRLKEKAASSFIHKVLKNGKAVRSFSLLRKVLDKRKK